MARLGRSPAVLVSAGLFLIFLALLSGHLYSIDGLQYFRVAERIVFDQSLVFDPPLVWGSSIITTPITSIGFSLVQVPAVLLAGWARFLQPAFSAKTWDMALLYGDPVYTLASWVNPLVVALTGALTFRTAGRLGASRRAAMLVAIATILGSPLFFYARADFAQPLSTLLMLGIVALLIDAVQRQDVRPGLMTGAVALAILTRPVDGMLIVFVALVVLCLPLGDWRPWRDARRLGVEVAIGVLAGLAVMFMVDFIRFGDPLNAGYQANSFIGSLGLGLVAELLSPGCGLLWYFPLLALAPIGAWALWRRGLRHETAAMVLPVLIYLPIYAEYTSLGGWAWGPRYLVPLIPVLGLLAGSAAWPQRRRAPVLLFGVLGIVGGLANVAHLAVDPLAFWHVYGDNHIGTPAIWRQFESGAYAPIGSWQTYNPAAGPDIMWLRLAGSTHGVSVFVFLLLLLLGVLALVRAWRLLDPMLGATRGRGS